LLVFAAVLGTVLLTLVLYHLLFVAPRIRVLRRAVRGEGANVRLALEGSEPSFITRTEQRLTELERIARQEIHRPGFVRYNAFDDVASELSYTCALLNKEGDGVVLSSIFSREETRTFGKRVRKFMPDQDISKEERDAITLARSGMGS
jgi:hypothetical protein